MKLQAIIDIEAIAIKKDNQDIFPSHHVEKIQSCQIENMKTTEGVNQNINDKLTRYNLHPKQPCSPKMKIMN